MTLLIPCGKAQYESKLVKVDSKGRIFVRLQPDNRWVNYALITFPDRLPAAVKAEISQCQQKFKSAS